MTERKRVGIRTLKNETSRIVNEVRERGAEYVVTNRGKAVGVLRPIREDEVDDDHSARVARAVANMRKLAGEVGKVSSGESAVSVVSRQRR